MRQVDFQHPFKAQRPGKKQSFLFRISITVIISCSAAVRICVLSLISSSEDESISVKASCDNSFGLLLFKLSFCFSLLSLMPNYKKFHHTTSTMLLNIQ